MTTRTNWKTGCARKKLLHLLLLQSKRYSDSKTCSTPAAVCQDGVVESDYTVSRGESVAVPEELSQTRSETTANGRDELTADDMEVMSCDPKSRDSGIESTNVLRSRGSACEMSKCSSERADIVQRLRLESCKRRSAKLDRQTRTQIILSNQRTKQHKVVEYYKNIKEKKAREVDETIRKQQARGRFKKAMWKVIWIIRWKLAMINISLDNMTMTAMEIDWHTRNTDASDALFNKSNFIRQKNSAKVPDWAEKIMRKPVEWRNKAERSRLHVLLRPLVSFERFTEKIQMAMCQAVRYEFVEAKRIVLRKGQPGHCFYFIYSGSVFVNVEEQDNDGETFIRTKSVLHAGESFGELALLQDSLRTATITCREDTELLTVDKERFSTVCPEIFEEELEIRIKFLRSLSVFLPSLIRDDDIQQLAFEGQIKQYKSNKVIVVDSSMDEWIYICMEGCCRVIKFLTADAKKDPPRIVNSDDNEDSELVSKVFAKVNQQANASLCRNKSRAQQRMREQLENPILKRSMSKVKMLSSLTMEWLEAHKQIELWKKQKRQEALAKNSQTSGMKSITELISDKKAQAKQNKYESVAVEIGVLRPTDIFDLHAIIRQSAGDVTTGSKLTLVSSGAKMLRIRRSAFFRILSFEAQEYMKVITSDSQYVLEEGLYDRYQNAHKWNCYRSKTLAEIIEARSIKTPPFAAPSLLQEKKTKENMLLHILKAKDKIDKQKREDEQVVERRQLFQFELETAFKDVQESVRRDLIIHKAAYVRNDIPLTTKKLTKRESATGSLPNLVDQLTTDQQAKHNMKRHSQTPYIRSTCA